MTNPVEVGFAILFAGLLLLMLLKWFRVEKASTDRRRLPLVMWLTASMLVQLVSKLLWPSAILLHRVTLGLGLISVIAVWALLRRDRHQGPTNDAA